MTSRAILQARKGLLDPHMKLGNPKDSALCSNPLTAPREGSDATLDLVRRRWEERLASLNTPGAGDRLRSMMDRPARLHGEVKAGQTF